MSRIAGMDETIRDLRTVAAALTETSNWLAEQFSSNDPLTKEDVRKLLSEKSELNGGVYKPQVKALVKKYSESGTLSTVKPEDYDALVAELKVIGDA